MVCAVCDKESNNRRVCPFCFTPYPADAPQSRQSTGTTRPSTSAGRAPKSTARPSTSVNKANTPRDRSSSTTSTGGNGGAVDRARDFFMKQSAVVRFTSVGIAIIVLVWAFTGGEQEKTFEVGSVPSHIIATPMQREEAIALLKQTRETALVDMQSDEVFVSYPAATFPILEEGQIALAQQFARADEIIEGRKRRIFFYNPSGRIFAQSDGVTGVTVK